MKWSEVYTKILRSLRLGARTGEEIRREIERDPNTSPLRSPVLHGIAILERHRYVQSGLYSTREGEIKLHALTQVGFLELVEDGYAPEHIRTPYLPFKKHLKHDREVTKVLRVSVEGCERSKYPYYFLDELELKKIFSVIGGGKGKHSFSDYEFGAFAENKNYQLHTEVDMGSERVRYVQERKLKINKGDMLFLCKDEKRIERIAERCWFVGKANILFSTLEQFYSHGLFDTYHWRDRDLKNCRLEDIF